MKRYGEDVMEKKRTEYLCAVVFDFDVPTIPRRDRVMVVNT